ncbi:MAG: hypothetical protein RL637_1201 [Pseudomonadota bacterium]|jgi:penicillin-binding protein 1A
MALAKLTLKIVALLSVLFTLLLTVSGYILYSKIIKDLPDINIMQDVQYQTPLSIYTYDKVFIAQFGDKRQTPISINQIPQPFVNAFLAAEDDRYYSHPGVDHKSLARALVQLWLTGEKRQGASTITMQVIRNFLLTRKKTYGRKLREIILALRIERLYSKEQILELYLNKIYMGHSAYGVVAAAETYYGKNLNQLTLAQQAMIAGLPKAPSIYNPITNPERAKQRRDYILRRMAELGFATETEVNTALAQADDANLHIPKPDLYAPYIAEMVRQELIEKYGESVYNSGMQVYTTITKPMQLLATQAIRDTLHLYDKRHGNTDLPHLVFTNLNEFLKIPVIGDTYPARIVTVQREGAVARLQNDTRIRIPTNKVTWRKSRTKLLRTVLKINDIVRVRWSDQQWQLTRVPNVQGAFAAVNPLTGAVLALEGGFDFKQASYNRATQAKRQPGSGFKPIIYTTALEGDFTTSTIINDAPIVIRGGTARDRAWHPQNYSNKFYGPTPLRTALVHSRNIVAIRILQELGIDKVIETALRFGFHKQQLPHGLSLALGSGYASPLQMAGFYSVYANGGFLVKPYFIERIEDTKGRVIFQAHPRVACPTCIEQVLKNPNYATRVITPQVNFLMNSLLRDVVQKGTATDAKVLERTDLAGKTGTTNDQKDAWFNGFVPNHIAATAWVGFDSAKSLGREETGGKAALPMWIEFMRTALKNVPEAPFEPPAGIIKKLIRSGKGSGKNSGKNSSGKGSKEGRRSDVWEYYIEDKLPKKYHSSGQYSSEDSATTKSSTLKSKSKDSHSKESHPKDSHSKDFSAKRKSHSEHKNSEHKKHSESDSQNRRSSSRRKSSGGESGGDSGAKSVEELF